MMDVLNWISANPMPAMFCGCLIAVTAIGVAHGLGPKG